jgi:hypothetical protein
MTPQEYFQIPDRRFTFPANVQELPVKNIDGTCWVPFSGQRLSKGWQITYRPIKCPLVRVIGWMSSWVSQSDRLKVVSSF